MFGKLIPWKRENGDIKAHHEDHPIARMRHDFEEIWDRFWDEWGSGLSHRPESRLLGSHLNVEDEEKEYVLRAELPGFEPEDIDVKVSGNVLTLRAEHKEEGEDKKGNGSYRRYGSFYESFTLPQGVLSDQIDAKYHSGVLELHVPKTEECQSKRIEVTAA